MTRFADMGPNQVNGWVAWANSHDWGGSKPAHYDWETGELVTYGMEHDTKQWFEIEGRHKSPAEMRAWAGY